MISLRQRVLWASLMASAAFAASAQQPAPVSAPVQAQMAPSGPVANDAQAKPGKHGQHRAEHHKKMDPAERHARMQKRMAERQAQLKDKLKLNGAQESAWSNYTGAIKPPAPPAGQPRPERVDLSKLSTPERLDRMQARQAERQARFAQRAQATKQFYAQLTPDQQKTFDAETAKRHGPHRHGHGPHHGHEGGKHAPTAPVKS